MFSTLGFGDRWAHIVPDLPQLEDDIPHPTTGEVLRVLKITMVSDFFVITAANSFLLSHGKSAPTTSWMVRPYYVSEEEQEMYARDPSFQKD